MKTKVAIVNRMGDPFVIEECELAEPKEGEVRLKVMTCTICHSDLHGIRGEHGAFEGSATGGHEIAGIVDTVGPGCTYVKPGDRVLNSLVREGCGACEPCLRGRQWFCENRPMLPFRAPGPYTRANGEIPIQTNTCSTGFAEYTNTPEWNLVKLDDDIPYAVGSLLACGFISGFGAVLNRCKVQPSESVAVIGCGGVGLSAVQGARVSGASPIIAIDTDDRKLEVAKKFGASKLVNPKTESAADAVKSVARGYGADYCVIAVAGEGMKRQALDLTAPWGLVCLIGHRLPEQEIMSDITAMEFMHGKRFTGSAMGAVTFRRDVPKYMEMYRNGVIDLDSMLTRHYPLDKINEAIEDAENGGAIKNVIVIGGLE
ncbi:MAG: alcohol dehydrogenase catalytic domain-containing protein [Clostridiales Family XIII bacterium]|jgi:S-(hydroxymethyl)glutathione dehydrogenase/alcohol dehydrogenase|nr:alcohol dehydrogenase catalytic domain-containing protein [Clostridiales Family XIII bacterium]